MTVNRFDWPDYLRLAEELGSRTEEECLRTAISRSYYYVYHLARRRVMDNGFAVVRGGDTHKQVWEKFDASPDPTCKKLYQIGKRLKDKRQRADYDLDYVRISAEFPEVLNLARRFADDLRKLSPRLPANSGFRGY